MIWECTVCRSTNRDLSDVLRITRAGRWAQTPMLVARKLLQIFTLWTQMVTARACQSCCRGPLWYNPLSWSTNVCCWGYSAIDSHGIDVSTAINANGTTQVKYYYTSKGQIAALSVKLFWKAGWDDLIKITFPSYKFIVFHKKNCPFSLIVFFWKEKI
jgi:hypothetical protein